MQDHNVEYGGPGPRLRTLAKLHLLMVKHPVSNMISRFWKGTLPVLDCFSQPSPGSGLNYCSKPEKLWTSFPLHLLLIRENSCFLSVADRLCYQRVPPGGAVEKSDHKDMTFIHPQQGKF